MDRNLALEFIRVTEEAALASARQMGKGDEKLADQAAVDAMRKAFDVVSMKGTVVIGEGERDEAPMLYIGEKVGSGDGPELDIALDPLEGTTITVNGGYNATSVVAVSESGNFLHAPDTYMFKLAVGPEAKGLLSIQDPVEVTLKKLAKAINKSIEDVTVCILERPRHEKLIADVRMAGCRIKLISDGDVSGAIATCMHESPVDILLGAGGAPEGVISAAALKCLGGDFQGQLNFRSKAERERAIEMGLKEPDKHFLMEELAGGDVMFCATGVTDGEMLKGVQFSPKRAKTHSMVMRSKSRTVRWVHAEHYFDYKPTFEG